MLISLLLLSMSLCLTTVVPLGTRAIAPTTDVTAVIAVLYSKYSSAAYSANCLSTDCPDVKSCAKYCSSSCLDLVSPTSTLITSLGNCITRSSCGIQTTAQLNPFNISINYGSCYLSAKTPTVELDPLTYSVENIGNKKFNVTNGMSFAWSNLTLQCGNQSLVNGPSSTVTSWPGQKLKSILSFFCHQFSFPPFFGFNFRYWLPCPSNTNSFSGPLQFTQIVSVTQLYTFLNSSNNDLTVQFTDIGVAPTLIYYGFIFDAGVPFAKQSTIQMAIENVFNNGDPNGYEFTIVKNLVDSLMTAFLAAFCPFWLPDSNQTCN